MLAQNFMSGETYEGVLTQTFFQFLWVVKHLWFFFFFFLREILFLSSIRHVNIYIMLVSPSHNSSRMSEIWDFVFLG